MNKTTLTVGSMSADCSGHITVEFTSEHPHHRHLTMGFRIGDSPALDKVMEDFATAAIAAAELAMLQILGDTSPGDVEAFIPKWMCRICDAVAPAESHGWVEILSGNGETKRHFCPDHATR